MCFYVLLVYQTQNSFWHGSPSGTHLIMTMVRLLDIGYITVLGLMLDLRANPEQRRGAGQDAAISSMYCVDGWSRAATNGRMPDTMEQYLLLCWRILVNRTSTYNDFHQQEFWVSGRMPASFLLIIVLWFLPEWPFTGPSGGPRQRKVTGCYLFFARKRIIPRWNKNWVIKQAPM